MEATFLIWAAISVWQIAHRSAMVADSQGAA
jgi:hypothetical protein